MTRRTSMSKSHVTACLFGLMTASLPMGTAWANTPASALEARNEATVRQAFEHWANQSGNVFDILAPDVSWTIHGSGPVAGTYRGRDDFLQRGSLPLVDRLASPVIPAIHHLWADEDRVVIRFDGAATTTSGAPYRNQFVWIFRMEDDLVVEAEAFLDLTAYQNVVDNNEPRPDVGGR